MPAPPPPPPAPSFNLGGGSADQGRGALLQSIRAGKPLKKTVTVDKSAPAVSGELAFHIRIAYFTPAPIDCSTLIHIPCSFS
jgi:hypothetical protein